MDFLSHGLWGALSTYPKYKKEPKKLLASLGVGMLPDVISFLPVQVYFVFTGFKFSPDLFFPVPQHWVFAWAIQSYNFTHSLVLCLLVMGIVWVVRKKFPLILLPWLLHVLMDIPTHPDFFQTPFLFPISDWKFFGGISWANPYVFFTNWILLIGFIVGIYISRKQSKMI